MSKDGAGFDPRFDPAFQPWHDGLGEAFEIWMPGGPSSDSSRTAAYPETELEEPKPPTRNRQLIATRTLAVELLASGIVLIGFARSMFDNRTEDVDDVTAQLLLVSGPIAIGLSIGIGASLLML